ncbi:MAG: trans-sulfuration enzyme family protein [Phycisphaerales bacterium JB039]
MNLSTRLITTSRDPGDPRRATAAPIYQTATFEQEDPDHFGTFDYTRTDNPTRRVLETVLADAEGARGALAFASGMAAISAVVRLVEPGERILVGEDSYGGTDRLLRRLVATRGVAVDCVDTTDLEAVEAALAPGARLILLETPSNPLLRISDLCAISALARARGALLAVDSTMMSPALQRPLDLGADLVIHSGTKFLGGHGDVTAGSVASRNQDLIEQLAFIRNAEGAALAPMEAWLLLRGLKTLELRIERQQASADAVGAFLREHPLVRRLHWLADPAHPGAALHRRQARGPGSILSFETGDPAISRQIAGATRLFSTAVSFGGVGSSISLPARMSHACVPEQARRARALPDDLVRISVGIEDPADLIRDLAGALEAACSPALAAGC